MSPKHLMFQHALLNFESRAPESVLAFATCEAADIAFFLKVRKSWTFGVFGVGGAGGLDWGMGKGEGEGDGRTGVLFAPGGGGHGFWFLVFVRI
jgi:hypothetical protein